MRVNKSQIHVCLSLLCAIGVFGMSSAFQDMAYWGEGLTWYWVGVALTYLIGVLGIVFLVIASIRNTAVKGKPIFRLSVIGTASFMMLLCGFCWTTFVIIARQSGM